MKPFEEQKIKVQSFIGERKTGPYSGLSPKRERTSISPKSRQQINQAHAYQLSLDENEKLRSILYCQLVDLPSYVTTKSLGISSYERDITIAQASSYLNKIISYEEVIRKYQAIVQKIREHSNQLSQMRQVNNKIRQLVEQIKGKQS